MKKATAKKTEKKTTAAFIPPQLCEVRKTPPAGGDWLHEVKFDGFGYRIGPWVTLSAP